jgi:hypothetical protein
MQRDDAGRRLQLLKRTNARRGLADRGERSSAQRPYSSLGKVPLHLELLNASPNLAARFQETRPYRDVGRQAVGEPEL